jgi:hypothetical protein
MNAITHWIAGIFVFFGSLIGANHAPAQSATSVTTTTASTGVATNPTCHVSASAPGKDTVSVDTNSTGGQLLNIDRGTQVTFTWTSTDTTDVTDPFGADQPANGTLTVIPGFSKAYVFHFTGPKGTVICGPTLQVKSDPLPPSSVGSFKVVVGDGSSSMTASSSGLQLYLPENIAGTFYDSGNKDGSYDFSYDLVPESGSSTIHFDNLARGREVRIGSSSPVSVLSSLPLAPKGSYHVEVSLYKDATDPHGFDIIRTLISKGKSQTFTLP